MANAKLALVVHLVMCYWAQGVTAKLKALLEAEKELGKSTKIE
jgi:hypothetical protein